LQSEIHNRRGCRLKIFIRTLFCAVDIPLPIERVFSIYTNYMANEGWIKLHRKIKEWEWYDDANAFRIFMHCLIEANHKDKTWKGHEIKRGQFHTSVANLGKDLKLSDKAIRGGLDKLIRTNEIAIKGANKGTTITVCNYDSYQGLGDDEGQAKGQTTGQTKGEQQGNERATTKNVKNDIKNENNEKEYKKILLSEIKISDFPQIEKSYYDIAVGFQGLIYRNIIELGASTTDIEKTKGDAIDKIRLLIENDGFTAQDCRDVYNFLKNSDFWKKNILSIEKLRKQFNKLLIEAKNGNSEITNSNSGYRKNTAGNNAEDKKRSVERLAAMAETLLQNLDPPFLQ